MANEYPAHLSFATRFPTRDAAEHVASRIRLDDPDWIYDTVCLTNTAFVIGVWDNDDDNTLLGYL